MWNLRSPAASGKPPSVGGRAHGAPITPAPSFFFLPPTNCQGPPALLVVPSASAGASGELSEAACLAPGAQEGSTGPSCCCSRQGALRLL